MKFLIALSLMISSTVFAQGMEGERKIKCYEASQQGGRGDLAYVMEERGQGDRVLHVVYPFNGPLKLDRDGCLSHPGGGNGGTGAGGLVPERVTLCPGAGQEIGRRVPVEASNAVDRTVYCDRSILDWFETDM